MKYLLCMQMEQITLLNVQGSIQKLFVSQNRIPNYHSPQDTLVDLFAKFTSTDSINARVNETGIRDNEKIRLKQVTMANGK